MGLGAGESEVIAVAVARPGSVAVLDDARGRSCAKTLGVPVLGTLGLIWKSKKAGHIASAAEIFLKKLVSDVLDRIDQFEDFDPRRDYALTVSDTELSAVERAARADTTATDLDEIELEP